MLCTSAEYEFSADGTRSPSNELHTGCHALGADAHILLGQLARRYSTCRAACALLTTRYTCRVHRFGSHDRAGERGRANHWSPTIGKNRTSFPRDPGRHSAGAHSRRTAPPALPWRVDRSTELDAQRSSTVIDRCRAVFDRSSSHHSLGRGSLESSTARHASEVGPPSIHPTYGPMASLGTA